jgi:hypothetical protein
MRFRVEPGGRRRFAFCQQSFQTTARFTGSRLKRVRLPGRAVAWVMSPLANFWLGGQADWRVRYASLVICRQPPRTAQRVTSMTL